jgi:hypothetical protein
VLLDARHTQVFTSQVGCCCPGLGGLKRGCSSTHLFSRRRLQWRGEEAGAHLPLKTQNKRLYTREETIHQEHDQTM